MKIVVLMGSPNKNSSSAHLAENFIRGAQEQGHTIKRIDAAHVKVSPCTGCIACGYEGPCAQKDGSGNVWIMKMDKNLPPYLEQILWKQQRRCRQLRC